VAAAAAAAMAPGGMWLWARRLWLCVRASRVVGVALVLRVWLIDSQDLLSGATLHLPISPGFESHEVYSGIPASLDNC
jgi:hypothetical protein